jgi:exopolysaccharide biosynthesis predicted pyruvyltransferase EpsI
MTTPLKMNGALAQLLSEFKGRDIVVLLNRGNRGDGVIHMGGRQFLNQLGIPHREVHETDDLSHLQGDVLLVHGAGAMSRGTHSLPALLKVITRRFQEIVILPSSFDLAEPTVRDFASTWDEKYSVFCRELVSFDALKRSGATPKIILLGHDLAFHADLKDWAAKPALGRGGIFRQDKEATYGKLPRDLDAFEDASYGSDREPERLLEFVSRFTEIHTDRCHAAITGAMMGRNVVFYRNNYFKNQAIYHHSLAVWPHVHFVKRTPFSFSQFARVTYWARIRPIEMKVRRVFQGRRVAVQS